jgi:tetratricopeptide (TPR) repeat protein
LRAVPVHRSILFLLCLALTGCRPGAGGNEQKEPYFLAGKNRVQERNFTGAIEMFEKALDVNPRSASAHFELAILYEQRQGDYAAALYHYQRAVNLRGDLPSADLARQRIQECKRELAKTVIVPVSLQSLQRDADNLRAENQLLKQQLKSWQDYYAGRSTVPTNPLPAATNPTPQSPEPVAARNDPPPPATRSDPPPRAVLTSASNRLHTIKDGDTMASVARRYNVKVAALQSANPTLDSKRLRPGQALVIPPP